MKKIFLVIVLLIAVFTTIAQPLCQIEHFTVNNGLQFSPAVDFADLDGSLLIANDRFKGMEVVKGKITLPDLPGIGVVKL